MTTVTTTPNSTITKVARTIHVMYRCRRHKLTVRRTFEHGYTTTYGWFNGMPYHRTDNVTYREGDKVVSYQYLPSTRCPQCRDRFMDAKPIEGRVVETVTCGAKCVNAVGPQCDCACGGENHGTNYANNVEVVVG